MNMYIQMKHSWQKRALTYKTSLNGVLFKGLPETINKSIHYWHSKIITSYFIPIIMPPHRIIDIGSGYGRLSKIVSQNIKSAILTGIDLSEHYCIEYKNTFGNAICADISGIPLKAEVFNGVIAVTILMYGKNENRILPDIINCLKKDGIALFIDPGSEFIKLSELVMAPTKNLTGGRGFGKKEYLKLFSGPDYSIIKSGSNLFFTSALPLLLLIQKMPKLSTIIGQTASYLDMRLSFFSSIAMHRWIIIKKGNQD